MKYTWMVLTGIMFIGCQAVNPNTQIPTQVSTAPGGQLTQTNYQSQGPIFIRTDKEFRPDVLKNALKVDIADQMGRLNVIEKYVNEELALVDEFLLQSPAPLNIYPFNTMRVIYSEEISSLGQKTQEDIFRFYYGLESINSFLAYRGEVVNSALSDTYERIRKYDKSILKVIQDIKGLKLAEQL